MKSDQGCQIFREKIYQTRENIPDDHKIFQRSIKIPNCRKIDQMAINCTSIFNWKSLQNYPNWEFWFEKIPSGNPGSDKSSPLQKIGVDKPLTERNGGKKRSSFS
jgi:hypothetical protein